MKHPRPTHPFLPPVDDRSTAISHVIDVVMDPTGSRPALALKSHDVLWTQRLHDVLVTYTPRHARNMQSTDVINLPCSASVVP